MQIDIEVFVEIVDARRLADHGGGVPAGQRARSPAHAAASTTNHLGPNRIVKSRLDYPGTASETGALPDEWPVGEMLRALADPTRFAIVERLASGPAAVKQVAAPFDLSLAAIVQHVQVLEACGVVATEKIGRVRTCRLRPGGLDPLAAWVEAHRTVWDQRLDRLGTFLSAEERLGLTDGMPPS